MTKNKDCTKLDNGYFKWCNVMEMMLEPEANTTHKGLIQLNVCNFKTHKQRCIGVAYKKSAKDRGIMLNVCPWCGKNILAVKEKEPPAQEAKE